MADKIDFPKTYDTKNKLYQQGQEMYLNGKLPLLLFVRSGVFSEAACLSLIVFAAVVGDGADISGVSISLPLVMGLLTARAKKRNLMAAVPLVKDTLDDYINGTSKSLETMGMCDHMMRVMARHTAQKNPKLFETMVANIKEDKYSISDRRLATAITLGYLKSNGVPGANTVLETFNEEKLPRRVYRRAKRIQQQNAQKSQEKSM